MNAAEINHALHWMEGEHVHVQVCKRGHISGRLYRAAIQPAPKNPHYGMTYYMVQCPGAGIIFCAANVKEITERETLIILQ